jgi:trehalose 6-phosphate phosphatase
LVAQLQSDVHQRLKNATRICLFADFDGTLVAISEDPSEPRLDPDTAEVLKLLASLDFVVATIISGRAVEDLYSRVALDNLIYAGNHGMEIFGKNLRFVHPGASALRGKLEELSGEFETALRPVAGASVECKGLTTSVHYRQATDSDAGRVERAVRNAMDRMPGRPFCIVPGNKVLEIMPSVGWHTGAAVRWINSRMAQPSDGAETLSVYLGDDAGDEEAFRALSGGVTIRVGFTSATGAHYQLPDPASVREFLQWLSLQETAHPRRA